MASPDRTGAAEARPAPDTHSIVISPKVDPAKATRAQELRRSPTPEEYLLWKALRANRLYGLHFRRQQVIDGFIADFYCHAAALVVELDGRGHERQADYDAERDRILSARGLRVLRIKNEEVIDHLARVLHRIATAAQAPP